MGIKYKVKLSLAVNNDLDEIWIMRSIFSPI